MEHFMSAGRGPQNAAAAAEVRKPACMWLTQYREDGDASGIACCMPAIAVSEGAGSTAECKCFCVSCTKRAQRTGGRDALLDARTHTLTHTHVHTRKHAHTHTHMHTHTHIHTHSHTLTHLNTGWHLKLAHTSSASSSSSSSSCCNGCGC
jgi:hypothetical protein